MTGADNISTHLEVLKRVLEPSRPPVSLGAASTSTRPVAPREHTDLEHLKALHFLRLSHDIRSLPLTLTTTQTLFLTAWSADSGYGQPHGGRCRWNSPRSGRQRVVTPQT